LTFAKLLNLFAETFSFLPISKKVKYRLVNGQYWKHKTVQMHNQLESSTDRQPSYIENHPQQEKHQMKEPSISQTQAKRSYWCETVAKNGEKQQ